MARIRIAVASALVTAAVACGGLAATPAEALTFDGQPVRTTVRFTVDGHPYRLRVVSIGSATRTIHVGPTAGKVFSRYRLTFTDPRGHVLASVHRGLEAEAWVLDRFTDAAFATTAAFRRTEHRALAVPAATARKHYLKQLRLLSVGADLEATIGATYDYLQALPAGDAPDFRRVQVVHSSEYRGDVTVSGDDRVRWTVTVRDRQDGYGEVFDAATGAESVLRF